MSNFVISLIRTWVPIVVGLLLTWLASSLHIIIDPSSQAGLVALMVSVVTAVYYFVVRWLSTKIPAIGILLGYASNVHYTSPQQLQGSAHAGK